MIVPSLPPLPDEMLAAHAEAHERLRNVLESAEGVVQRLFVMLQRRIFVESLAYVQPVLGGMASPLVFPAPRAYLSRTQELRVAAAAAAFRFLDSRLAMVRLGLAERMLDPTLPVVLHALMEGVAPSGVETNAGMVRVTPTAWRPEANAYVHPSVDDVPDMLEAAVDMAMHAPAPAIARAGWLTFTMLSIHPFVDGNGRTSRAIFHAVVTEDPGVEFEWGVAEQWALHRRAYVEALQVGQRMETYDAERLDPLPFMVLSIQASTVGAHLAVDRIEALTRRVGDLVADRGLSQEAAHMAVAVGLNRVVTVGELCSFLGAADDLDTAEVVPIVEALVDLGVLAWAERPPSRRTMASPDASGLVPAIPLISGMG